MNKARGETGYQGPDGNSYKLCLTLGAMAEIESGLGLESFDDIEQRLSRPKISDLLVILVALLKGGGHRDMSADDLYGWPFDEELFNKIAESMNRATPDEIKKEPSKGN